MKRFFLIVGALAALATMSLTDAATAKPGSGAHPGGSHAAKPGANHAENKAPSHQPGVQGSKKPGNGKGDAKGQARGRHYRNWRDYCWFPDCGAYGFLSSDDAVWYYWYEPMDSYLPVSFMDELPPTGTPPMTPPLPPGAVPVK